ncbi:MAG TPA: hypothetical protein VFN64_04755 [Burkholderiaceae bacterium]|nr:hypothetical protein [Burkholderiaceae bacterium]
MAAQGHWHDRYVDPEDGQFDFSEYLLMFRGLLGVPIIITEPALGCGSGLAALVQGVAGGSGRARRRG